VEKGCESVSEFKQLAAIFNPDLRDDVGNKIYLSVTTAQKKRAAECIFRIICASAFEGVVRSGNVSCMKKYELLADNFAQAQKSLLITCRETLICHFHQQRSDTPTYQWPQDVLDLIESKKNRTPTTKFTGKIDCSTNKSNKKDKMSEEDMKHLYFGYQISEARADISSDITKLTAQWIDEDRLPSGWSKSSFIYALRVHSYTFDQQKRANARYNKGVSRTKDEDERVIIKQEKKSVIQNDAVSSSSDCYVMPIGWFAYAWFHFLLFGKPVGENKIYSSFRCGRLGKAEDRNTFISRDRSKSMFKTACANRHSSIGDNDNNNSNNSNCMNSISASSTSGMSMQGNNAMYKRRRDNPSPSIGNGNHTNNSAIRKIEFAPAPKTGVELTIYNLEKQVENLEKQIKLNESYPFLSNDQLSELYAKTYKKLDEINNHRDNLNVEGNNNTAANTAVAGVSSSSSSFASPCLFSPTTSSSSSSSSLSSSVSSCSSLSSTNTLTNNSNNNANNNAT